MFVSLLADLFVCVSVFISRELTFPTFSELKGSLKKFIDLTAELQDGNSSSEGSPYGYLIQVLTKCNILLI